MTSIYFDYNATTPLDPKVLERMLPCLESVYGNPSSVHRVGRKARCLLDDCRYRLASLLKCKPSEIVFTGGGTESNNLAIFGAARQLSSRGRHLITSSIEHHAVLSAFAYLGTHEAFDLTVLPVDGSGFLDPSLLEQAIRPDTILVSIMAANNEIGSLYPVELYGRICRERGVAFHTDALQSFGKVPFSGITQFSADLVSLCAHKFHGPKGAGALYIRSPLQLVPLLHGGAQENDRRPGTENLAAIVGLVEAFERFVPAPVFRADALLPLTERLAGGLSAIEGVTLRSPASSRLCNTVAISVAGCDSMSLLAALDVEGVCASGGSACSSGSIEPSHVLLGLGLPRAEASSLLRFSLGRDSTQAEVDTVVELLCPIVDRIRQAPS